MYRSFIGILVCACISFSGCGLNYTESGFGGAAIGAGVGAAIGSAIKNGSIGKSAAIGGLIGFPVGIALNLAAEALFAQDHLGPSAKDYSEEIEANQREIIKQNAEIESLRSDIHQDTPRSNPAPRGRGTIFDGATYGNLYR